MEDFYEALVDEVSTVSGYQAVFGIGRGLSGTYVTIEHVDWRDTLFPMPCSDPVSTPENVCKYSRVTSQIKVHSSTSQLDAMTIASGIGNSMVKHDFTISGLRIVDSSLDSIVQTSAGTDDGYTYTVTMTWEIGTKAEG